MTSAVILTFCSSAALFVGFEEELEPEGLDPDARSCPAAGEEEEVLRMPALLGTAAALAPPPLPFEAGGAALNALRAPLPEEDTEIPEPGEIWLEALSRLLPLPCPVSISLSSAVICRALPYRSG